MKKWSFLKRALAVSAVGVAAAAVLVMLSFRAVMLPVEANAGARVPVPSASPPAELRMYALPAGKMYARAVFAYRGGGFSDERVFVAGAIFVDHPQGGLLFDAGFGKELARHVETNPWLMRSLSRIEPEPTVAEQLAAAGVARERLKAVVLTHAHWDHVSGVEDLSGVPVWVTKQELAFIHSGSHQTELARQIGTKDYREYTFDDGPYLGFESSYDVFRDGSVVLVPAYAHTPGSIIAFIALPSGKRYALVGDLVWQREGIDLPAERPWLARRQVDTDAEAVRSLIVRLHQLARAMPELTVVPAHDRRVWDTLDKLE